MMSGVGFKIRPVEVLAVLGILAILSVVVSNVVFSQVQYSQFETSVFRSHNLAIASYSYANEHDGFYPMGTSSTAIFQQLFFGNYLTEAGDVFLTANGGKCVAEPAPAIKLTAKNVSWDYVTRTSSGLKLNDDPGQLPLVFSCVSSPPSWNEGVNTVRLDDQCPHGTDFVTIADLDQRCASVHPNPSGEIPLTKPAFKPAEGIIYLTRTP